MSRSSSSARLLLPLFVGALAFAAGCAFEPPDSVLGNGGQGEDGSGNGGGNGGGGGGGGGGNGGGSGADAGAPVETGTESMTVTYTTQKNTGNYQEQNVVATWIEDSAGGYVATIDRQSNARTRNLVAWKTVATGGEQNTDAVSGATRPNHLAPVTATWTIPAGLADGVYTVRMETCDSNATTAAENKQGSFTFEKNGMAKLQSGLTGDGYTNVSIDYKVGP